VHRVVLLAAAFGVASGLLASALMHYLPIAGDFTFFTYGDAGGEPIDIGRPTWWPSVVVLPLALGVFSAGVASLAHRSWLARSANRE
jgi:hypothetical protein